MMVKYIVRTFDKSYEKYDPLEAARAASIATNEVGSGVFLVVTDREYIRRVEFRSLPVKTLHMLKCQEAWAVQRVHEGELLWNLTVNAPGVIQNLMEAVLDKLGPCEKYSTTIPDAIEWAEQRQTRLEREVKSVEGEVRLEFKPKISDAYQVWELLDKQALLREGLVMHHCVGDYEPDPKKRRFFSVRDNEGQSHATIETVNSVSGFFNTPADPPDWRIFQARGPSNVEPAADVQTVIDDWTQTTNIKRPERKVVMVDLPMNIIRGVSGIGPVETIGISEPIRNFIRAEIERREALVKITMLKPRSPVGDFEVSLDFDNILRLDDDDHTIHAATGKEEKEAECGTESVGRSVAETPSEAQPAAGARSNVQGSQANSTVQESGIGLGAIRGH